jgi:hypothetical protein
MTRRPAWACRASRVLRPVLISTVALGVLLGGIGPAAGDDGADGPESTEDRVAPAETTGPVLSWGDLRLEASLECEPERPAAGQDVVCVLGGGRGFDAVDVTFAVLRLLDEYDEGQLTEVIQEEARRVAIDTNGDATMAFALSSEALPGDVYDVAAFGSSTTACYAAAPLVDDTYDLEDGMFTILAGPGVLTVDDDGEGFAIDGEAFRLDDVEPICHYVVAWFGGEVDGTAPPDDHPGDDEGGTDGSGDDDTDGGEPAADDEPTATEPDETDTGTALPATGVPVGWWIALGALLLAGGMALTVTRRRVG